MIFDTTGLSGALPEMEQNIGPLRPRPRWGEAPSGPAPGFALAQTASTGVSVGDGRRRRAPQPLAGLTHHSSGPAPSRAPGPSAKCFYSAGAQPALSSAAIEK